MANASSRVDRAYATGARRRSDGSFKRRARLLPSRYAHPDPACQLCELTDFPGGERCVADKIDYNSTLRFFLVITLRSVSTARIL